jgi:hypothetical protein
MRFTVEGTYEEIIEFISHTTLKPPDFVLPEGSIFEPYGYGDKIFKRLDEKLRKKQESVTKKDSVLLEIAPGAHLGDRIEPDHHLDVHGGVD